MRDLKDTHARFILAIIACTLAGFALGALVFREIPVTNKDALLIVLGIVLGLSKDSYGFYFGASKGGIDLAEHAAGIKGPVPKQAGEAAESVADAAAEEAERLKGNAE